MTSLQKIRYSSRRFFSMPFSIASVLLLFMAMGGVVGCSSSTGEEPPPPSFSFIGYDGETGSVSSSTTALLDTSSEGLKFLTEAPWFVNLTYQVVDQYGYGVTDLQAEDFHVVENGIPLDRLSSNINIRIRKRNKLPEDYSYTLKTVILIDNSATVSLEMLDTIKQGARTIVKNIDELKQQEIAVVAFDNIGDPVLVSDFTSNTKQLEAALNFGDKATIKRSFGTANFYGAVQYALNLWDEKASPSYTSLTQGFLVLITQGNDTAGLYNLRDAIAARDRANKRIFTVPVGSVPDDILTNMERLGNAGFYPVPTPDIPANYEASKADLEKLKTEDKNLADWTYEIQKRMIAFADSFYWMQYRSAQSSAPGARHDHVVEVSLHDNPNTAEDAVLTGAFSSKDFITGEKGVYFNASTDNPSGVTEVIIEVERGMAAGSVTESIHALTYSRDDDEKVPSEFEWTSQNNAVASVSSKNGVTNTIIANKPGETRITVVDKANGVSKDLSVKVVVREFSYEIIQHEVESASPWFADATFQVRETCDSDEFCCPGTACTDDKPEWINQWKWITDMKREEFLVYENKGRWDETLVDLEKSEVHLRKRDRLPSNFSYTLKTVLFIDNSPSAGDDQYMDLMRNAAKAFVYRALVNNPRDNTDKGPLLGASGEFQQEIAIYAFHKDGDEFGDGYLVQDFTSDINVLNSAIDDIPRGYGPINFYGGMVDALQLWQNDQSPRDGNTQLRQGVLVALTDGHHSNTGFGSREAVLAARKDKQIICVGVGDDIATAANVNDLRAFANAGYYSVPAPGTLITRTLVPDNGKGAYSSTTTLLAEILRDIQHEILDYANSFYWLNYKSYVDPAVGNCPNTTDLDIFILNNANTTNNNSISGEFETCGFFDGVEGAIYVNSTASNPWGTDTYEMKFVLTDNVLFEDTGSNLIQSIPLEATTYKPDNLPSYTWASSNTSIAVVEVDTTSYANSRAIVKLPANPRAGSCQIMVEDENNTSPPKLVTIRVEAIEFDFPEPIAYYPFSGDAADATDNGYDGSVYGATLTQDRFGNPDSAYSFNGQSNYIALDMYYGPGGIAQEIREITVAAWVKFTSYRRQAIIAFEKSGVGGPWALFADPSNTSSTNEIAWITTGPDQRHFLSATGFNDGKWHFIVGTYDANLGVKKLFIDGRLIGTALIHNNASLVVPATKIQGIIGSREKTNSDYMNGLIDDVIIFQQALTADEIDFLYQMGGTEE